MRLRFPALAMLSALILAACSDRTSPTSPLPRLRTASMAIDPGVACNGATMPVIECQALVALYNNTNGPAWTDAEGWGTTNPCRWNGVTCTEGDHGSVLRLDLTGKGLNGPVPAELANLDQAEGIWLAANELTGAIPPELGGLASIISLRLSYGELIAPIPTELTNLATLSLLDIHADAFAGSIPPEFGNFPALTILELSLYGVVTPIPASLGNLASLRILRLNNSTMTGPIPASLGNLANLEWLNLAGNELSGPLPPELGNLAKLEKLDLGWNNLTGAIPATYGNLGSLEQLSLENNDLTGPIPAVLANLVNLEFLNLWRNALSGPIPPALGNLPNLKYLWLSENALTGTIPAGLGQLALESLHLRDNQLSGQVPLAVAELGETMFSSHCDFAPGNGGLFMPDVQAYRDADTNGDRMICDLPIGTAQDIGEDAIEDIDDLVPGTLNGGQANALKTKIENAMAKAAAGQYAAAINQMQAFVTQLNDMVANGTLTPAQAAPFIQQAEWMIAMWSAML